MGFDQYYVALLRKGPAWSLESNSAVEQTQKVRLAHLAGLRQAGKLAIAGPVKLHDEGDIRGISIFLSDEVGSTGALPSLVEEDPAFKSGRLVATT